MTFTHVAAGRFHSTTAAGCAEIAKQKITTLERLKEVWVLVKAQA
jgi:hypothetical protein